MSAFFFHRTKNFSTCLFCCMIYCYYGVCFLSLLEKVHFVINICKSSLCHQDFSQISKVTSIVNPSFTNLNIRVPGVERGRSEEKTSQEPFDYIAPLPKFLNSKDLSYIHPTSTLSLAIQSRIQAPRRIHCGPDWSTGGQRIVLDMVGMFVE